MSTKMLYTETVPHNGQYGNKQPRLVTQIIILFSKQILKITQNILSRRA